MEPLVSVIIPAYNASATLDAAIGSVLIQSYPDFEVIVINDGSTDRTAEILRGYGDRIRVVGQENRGAASARNTGLEIARGSYIAFLDADDLWKPELLARLVPVLEADPGCVLAYADLEIVDSNGHSLRTSLIGGTNAHAPTLDEMLHRVWPIMPSAVVMRKSVLEAIGGFCTEFKSCTYEDLYCWMRAREHGHFIYLPERLAQWRFSLYPRRLKRGGGVSSHNRAVFARLVRERWGVAIAPLIDSRVRAPRSILGYIGLTAMRDGDLERAREAFRYALELDPRRVKNYFRLARTYLPARLARALSGRTGSQPV
ncbi:MAG TPA: glycosyltransferase [Candidatus Binataceae bacterium]|nr:glycosyltransferase [Candidatus Binataceae bacterium]